jgi:hypothetical protein
MYESERHPSPPEPPAPNPTLSPFESLRASGSGSDRVLSEQ